MPSFDCGGSGRGWCGSMLCSDCTPPELYALYTAACEHIAAEARKRGYTNSEDRRRKQEIAVAVRRKYRRLIAAAPDLYEACKDALSEIVCHAYSLSGEPPRERCDCRSCAAWKALRAALKKAEEGT